MRTVPSIAGAGVLAGALLFSGCSPAGSAASPASMPQAGAQSRAASAIAYPNGVDKRYAGTKGSPESRMAPLPEKTGKVDKDLFVSDGNATVFLLKNKTYAPNGSITSGMSSNDGIWVDKSGNLYVANVGGKNVTEYAPGSSSPSCTYDAGMVDPINVTTDAKGDVFVADFNDLNAPGYVDEFKQCTDKIAQQYSIDKGPEGIAVDSKGDIFVSYFNLNFTGSFVEFPKGKNKPVTLGVTVGSPAGLIIDKKGNLIADDQEGFIDIIAPPYTSATQLVTSGLSDPLHVSLSKNGKVLFNANAGAAQNVTVYAYPSGKLTTTLDSSNGLDGVEGVSDSPNTVF
jgi:hypothetical protein